MAVQRIDQLQQWLNDAPEDPFLHFALAKEWEKMRFPEKALEEYLWIFREAPDYGGAYYHGVRLLARLDRLDEARTLLETGLAVNRRQNDRHNVAELQALSDELFG